MPYFLSFFGERQAEAEDFMKKFEYFEIEAESANLTDLGLEGWELVVAYGVPTTRYDSDASRSRDHYEIIYVFKREIL